MAVRDMRIVGGFGMTFEQKTGLGTGGLVTPHSPDVLPSKNSVTIKSTT